MQIEYSLTIDDILALHGYRLQVESGLRGRYWTRRFLYVLGFGLIGLGGFWLTYQVAILYGFAALGILAFAVYPLYLSGQLRRRLEKTYAEDKARRSLSNRTLHISGEGLEQTGAGSHSHIAWDDVDDMGVTDTHAFISAFGRTAWTIIPRQGLRSGDFEALVAEMRRYLEMPPGETPTHPPTQVPHD